MSRGAFSGKGGSAKYTNAQIMADGSSSGGQLDEIFELSSWSADLNCAIPKHVSNATGGVRDGIMGTRDSSGSLEVKIHRGRGFPFGPGQLIELVLDTGTGTIPKTLGVNYVTLMARIESTALSIQLDGDGEAVAATFNWQGIRPWAGYGIFEGLWAAES